MNEFKVGDLVVKTSYSSPRIWRIKELNYNGNPRYVLLESDSWVDMSTIVECIRHATEEEVKAGRRL